MLMILFGLAEVVTGFTHHFSGISTAKSSIFTYEAAAIGSCYIVGGLLIMTMKKWAAALTIVLLGVDIAGRLTLVGAGLYPMNSLEQVTAIITGTGIAAIFAIYIALNWSFFR
jgi:hypothetical protein